MNELLKLRLLHQYDQLDTLVKDLSENFIQKRHKPDKWSIHENIAHLGRYHEIFINRIENIIKEEQASFGRYNAIEDAFFETWIELSTKETMRKTKELRKILVEKVLNLEEQQLNRTGIHPALGHMNIMEWTEFFLLHESHHFYTIFWLAHENLYKD